ncbi:CRTAC1 family protein [Azospirillum sp. B4]|uniref:CRTAC1 family protein n=1 Tax=Azospirillum sp. B4 TaxID=95605 RepID=UPI0003466B5E|nr:CRTAC1 family protein [Azospirillum sp. B4]
MFIACSNLIVPNPPISCAGIAVGDIDGDGRFDFVITCADAPNRVLSWDGGALVEHPAGPLADAKARARAALFADMDGDGREELYILNEPGAAGSIPTPDRLFACFGNRWVDLAALPENFAAANRAAGTALACLDRHGTGRYSIVVGGQGVPLQLFELDRRGRLHEVAEEAGLDIEADARLLLGSCLTGSLPDLFVGCAAGPNLLFRNLGGGQYEEIADAVGLDDPHADASAATILDADGDGLVDLLLGNAQGPQRLFQHRAGGGFVDVTPEEMAQPGPVRAVIAADFDNDGYEELFFNMHGQPNRLFAWREDRWVSIDLGDAAEPEGLGTAAVVADIDGDGQLELLIGHGDGEGQPLSLFLASPTGNNWLRVLPLTAGGAPARGATVCLTAGERRQLRSITGGSGGPYQREPVAHFGLGDLTVADLLEITWPDGATLKVERPDLCRLMVVHHPSLGQQPTC